MLQNSQAFDLGIDHDASPDDVDEAIRRMDDWGLVLITEYMDESLVLLARRMCWSIDDVAYYALKVCEILLSFVLCSYVLNCVLCAVLCCAVLYCMCCVVLCVCVFTRARRGHFMSVVI